ncbi:MAG: hypothetical protein JWS10_2033 [Cypionkella sp.]|nr:hypothetical protein [Cypionkella sp.]MDB5666319.1 hypothetical protein [Cypionkella sp.]
MLPKLDMKPILHVTSHHLRQAAVSIRSVIFSMPVLEVLFFAAILSAVR